VTSEPRGVDDNMRLAYRTDVYRDGTSWIAEFPELAGLVAEHELGGADGTSAPPSAAVFVVQRQPPTLRTETSG
jgi:hypothetical protein